MITFRFTINESFRSGPTHPITVPKSQVDYSVLSDAGLGKGEYTIIFPKGERARGHMYSGVAGYGPYFQLRFHSGESPPKYLTEGDKVMVLLFKDGPSKFAAIELRK